MTIITLPSTLALEEYQVGQKRFDLDEVSDSTGDASARLMAPPRWRLSMRSPQKLKMVDASVWQAFLLKTRGRINLVQAWDVQRPAPRGTMRGILNLAADVPAGATTAPLIGAVGTLEFADWLQIGTGLGTSQLVSLVEATSSSVLSAVNQTWTDGAGHNQTWTDGAAHNQTWFASGTAVITFEAPLRRAYTKGTVVIWDKPSAYFRAITEDVAWTYAAGGPWQGGFSQDFIEAFQ